MCRALGVVLGVVLLTLSTVSCTSMSDATYKTLKAAFGGEPEVGRSNASGRVDPAFRTLRVATAQTQAILVLGEIESSPDGEIEVWFSAQREVIRLQNGRIAATSGLSTNWVRSVYQPLGASTNSEGTWRVTRDISPGWTYGQSMVLRRSPVHQVPSSVLKRFSQAFQSQQSTGNQFEWISESPSDLTIRTAQPWQTAYFARTRQGRVVAGYQCLAADLCLAWERLQR
jgi:hypothetical protein